MNVETLPRQHGGTDRRAPRGKKRTKRSRGRKFLYYVVIPLLVLVLVAVGGAWYLQSRFDGQIERQPDVFAGLTDRPAAAEDDSLNILLLGSDKRADGSIAGQRSDATMLMQISGDRESISVISIPRDSWVTIPGYGPAKVNAALSYGGESLAVQTLENLSDVRIDHVAVIDWDGFVELTDALGGVTVEVSQTTTDTIRGITWEAGAHEMDGEEALNYVGQRYGLPGGDLDRVKRQQNYLRALLGETLSRGTLTSPTTLYSALDAVTSNLIVDEEWTIGEMRDLAWSSRNLRMEDVMFTTIPVTGTGMVGDQSVVFIDTPKANELWAAMREGNAAQWIEDNGANLSETVR